MSVAATLGIRVKQAGPIPNPSTYKPRPPMQFDAPGAPGGKLTMVGADGKPMKQPLPPKPPVSLTQQAQNTSDALSVGPKPVLGDPKPAAPGKPPAEYGAGKIGPPTGVPQVGAKRDLPAPMPPGAGQGPVDYTRPMPVSPVADIEAGAPTDVGSPGRGTTGTAAPTSAKQVDDTPGGGSGEKPPAGPSRPPGSGQPTVPSEKPTQDPEGTQMEVGARPRQGWGDAWSNLTRGNLSDAWGATPGYGKALLGAGGGALLMMLLSKLFGKQGSYTTDQIKHTQDTFEKLSEVAKIQLYGETMANPELIEKIASCKVVHGGRSKRKKMASADPFA